jgi:hypothetical protein
MKKVICLETAMPNLPSDFDYSATKNGAIDGALCRRREGDRRGLPVHRRAGMVSAWLSPIAAVVLVGLDQGRRAGGSINVATQRHSVTLKYRSRSYGEDWSDVEQRVAIEWTPCRFGGERPWFACSVSANGVYCGRTVTKLYGAGRLFACRHCYRLAYVSQKESAHQRGLGKSQKIRMRLGGSPNMLEDFPEKPKGMHWRTYERWCRVHDAAEERSTIGLMSFVGRLGRRLSRRA